MNLHPETRGVQSPRCHTAQLSPQGKCHFPCQSQKAEDLGMCSVLLVLMAEKLTLKALQVPRFQALFIMPKH